MIDYEVKFLTNDETLNLRSSDFKSFRYDSKKKHEENIYDISKRNYLERRGGYYKAPKPRPLKQLELKLNDRRIIACKWFSEKCITLVFSSGVISYLTVNPNTLDVTQLVFDKYCVGKLIGQTVTEVVICRKLVLFVHPEKTATLLTFGKCGDHDVSCLVCDREPHIQHLELGGSARRIDRRVSSFENSTSVNLLVWGTNVSEPAPWSPVIEDHANLHLYQICGQQATLRVYHQLENEVILAEISQRQDNVFHILEQTSCHKNGVSLIWLRYELPQGNNRAVKLTTLTESAIRIPIAAPARIARLSPCDFRLITACIDGSIHVIHFPGGITHSTKAGFIATDLQWAGDIVIAAEETGRLQCFDRGLSLLHQHTKCLDLTSYFRESRRMQLLGAQTSKGGPIVLATFSGGPLTLLKIRHPRLITAWIRSGRMSNAVTLLRALDWELEANECVRGIDEVVVASLRRGGGAGGGAGGAGAAAQAALGVVLGARAPRPPAPPPLASAVHRLARKYYHHLLRRGHIEKALSLGVELGAWDLFADAGAAARRRGQPALQQEATQLARLYCTDSECSESCSQCSSESSTRSEDESSTSSKPIKTNPPPLPRIPLPPQPSILAVPITPNEPHSTNSIRPNLHQYLERDNTIWNTNIRDDLFIQYPNLTLQKQNIKWNSMDNVLSPTKDPRTTEGIAQSRSKLEVITHDERIHKQYKYLLQTELKEELNQDRYNFVQLNNPNFNGRYRQDANWPVRPEKEKNKVKFSETVTVAVVPESPPGPDVARELADSLPLCAPHKYLAAFAPAPAPGTALDYVEHGVINKQIALLMEIYNQGYKLLGYYQLYNLTGVKTIEGHDS